MSQAGGIAGAAVTITNGSAMGGLPLPQRYWAIAAISLGTLLTIIDGAIANVALPVIARDLKIDGSAAVLIVTVYNLVLVMALLPFSALGDRIGLKRLYQVGQLTFTVATALCFFAHSLPFLLAIRALQALGGAAALSVMSALIRVTYPSNQLGRGVGVNTIIVAVANALAPTAGGAILDVAPWPWLFAAGVPFALLSLALGWIGLPDVPSRNLGHRYDTRGAVFCVLTFALIFSGMETGVHGGPIALAGCILLSGLAFAVLLIRHELGEKQPVMPIDLLREPLQATSTAAAFACFTGMMVLFLSLPFRLENQYGLSASAVGLMVAAWPMTTMIVGPVVGILSDRLPAGALGAMGMAVATSAFLLLAYPPEHVRYIDIAWRMSLCGFGFSVFMVPNTRVIIGSAPLHRSAAAGGLLSTTRLAGQTLGASIVATLLALGLGEGPVPALIACLLGVIAGMLSIARIGHMRRFDRTTIEATAD
jgi:DHA2 family multidrug resistance protein-like MFS transporter